MDEAYGGGGGGGGGEWGGGGGVKNIRQSRNVYSPLDRKPMISDTWRTKIGPSGSQ